MVTAVDTPELGIVREGLVVLTVHPEAQRTLRALAAEIAVLVEGHTDAEPDLVALPTDGLRAVGHSELTLAP
ncbi:hypothetical protein PV367_06910 [Streptomyces europaeiscabiei]|uniref:Uncharacterized protein n=1 Tax=Streptomyces europaeiscabiei TaxID=146819 RepID=A0AAJ2PL61_9ACTN|nr:hypothetical protein [Streptomyces europaeiscabiei]MDX3129537.1 hypothetical protein [Streptomyces europaeiscabiei]